jgi:hypothetical protein
MSEYLNTKLLASLAIVAALALVGVVAVQTILVQEAFAQPTGCSPGKSGPGQGFFSSDRKCFHTPGQR